jgi:hypothetical protein
MESAFGVEHGEVSKALTPAGRRKAQHKANVRANQQAAYARNKARLGKLTAIPGKAANAKVSVADVGRGVGRVAELAGKAVAAKPAVTGAAVLGGAGYSTWKSGRKKNKTETKL